MSSNEQSKFWQEVEQAYLKVAADHNIRFIVEREGKRAEVGFISFEQERLMERIWIEITEVPTEVKEPLISP